MLALQKILMEKNSLSYVQSNFKVNVYRHPEEPLVGFKYNHISDEKYNPVIVESRGIVLEDKSWKLVSKGFNRFFNLGENPKQNFDWSNFFAESKEDGSLIFVYKYKDKWEVNTSGSFGFGNVSYSGSSWRDLFWNSVDFTEKSLEEVSNGRRMTFVFELCTKFNKVVRFYKEDQSFLLSAFVLNDFSCCEVTKEERDSIGKNLNIKTPLCWSLGKDISFVNSLVDEMEKKDPTFEGFVLRDSKNNRIKYKTKTYVSLHKLKDNGNIFLAKNLVPLILSDDVDEVVSYFPEIKKSIATAKKILKKEFDSLLVKWEENKDIIPQRKFATRVKDHKLSFVLFEMRKNKKKGIETSIDSLISKKSDKIARIIFGKKSFNYDGKLE